MIPTRKTILAFLITVALAAPAAASTARLTALGGNDYLQDERSVLRWCASLVDYGDVVVFDVGRFDTGGGGKPWSDRIAGQSGGVHARFDEAGRWGTLAAYFHSQAVMSSAGQVHADYPGGGISLIYARSQGAFDLGLRFRGTSYARFHDAASPLGEGREDYRHDYGLGLRWRHGDHLAVEVAGELRNSVHRTLDEIREMSYLGAGSTDSYALRARARWQVSPVVTVVPLLAYARDLGDIYSVQLDDVAAMDGYLLQAGFGVDVARTDGGLMVFSAEYRDGKEDHRGRHSLYRDYDTLHRTWYTILVRAGIEEPLLPWLTLRASLQYRRVDDESRSELLGGSGVADFAEDDVIDVTTPLGLGLTASVGRVRLDAAYNDQSPLSQATVPDANAPREAANYATVSLRYLY